MSKRGPNIETNRLFLRSNRHWRSENGKLYDNMSIGRNTIQNWTKSSADAIGLNTKVKKY